MDDYAIGYDDGLVAGAADLDAIDGKIALALGDEATAYDLGFIAGLAAAKARQAEHG